PRTRPGYWLSRFRQASAERLDAATPDAADGFLRTVWFGDRRQLDEETYRGFVGAGTAHVLAVSGLHVGIVFMAAAAMFRPFVRSRRLWLGLALAGVWLFVLMAGA